MIIRKYKKFIITAIIISIPIFLLYDCYGGLYNKKSGGHYISDIIRVPFAVSAKGNKIEFTVKPKEDSFYGFSLLYHYYDPTDDPKSKYYIHPLKSFLRTIPFFANNFKKLLEIKFTDEEVKEIRKDSRRIRKLAANDGYKKVNGKLIPEKYNPPKVKVKITIEEIDKDGNKIKRIFDEIKEPLNTNSGGGYYHRGLGIGPEFQSNHIYKVTAISILDAPRLKDTEISFRMLKYFVK